MKKKILLCGHNEELHDKIVDEEGSFGKVIKRVEDLKSKKENFNIIIKATKLNFFCLDKIISFAYQLMERNESKKIKFSIVPLRELLKNFQVFINKNNKILRKDRISIIPDKEILELFNALKRKANSNNENDILRLLGVICETTFIGPKQLLIDVENKCNSDCIFCWIHSPLIRDKTYSIDYCKELKEINLNTFKRIIDAAASIKVEEIVLVGDGEPTIHERFPEMIEYINKKGLKIMLFSNGLLLNKYFKTIVDNNVANLELTISAATQKTYKNLHPSAKKGTLDNIKNSIKELSKYKKKTKKTYPKITIVNIINNKNYNELIMMTKFAKEVGADEVAFKLIELRDFSMFLKLNGEQIKVVKGDIRKAKELAKEINIEIQDHFDFQLENINVKTGNWSENVYTKTGCFIGWWFGYYRLDDVFTFCCSIKEVDKLKDKSFGEIWFSDDYNKFRIAGKYLSENKNLEFKDGRRLFEPKCNNCDNTVHLNIIQYLLKEYELEKFLFSSKKPIKNSYEKGVMLVNLPPWGVNNPPLSLACLSEYLESKNISVKVFDFNIELYNLLKEKYSNLWHVENKNYWSNDNLLSKIVDLISYDIEEWVDRIINSNIMIIAFSVVDPKERLAIHIIKMIKKKKPEVKIVLGGPACATPASRSFFEERIPELIDVYIVGEGEETLTEVVKKINQSLPLENVLGVIIFKNNNENNFIPREPLKPEDIPSPRYDGFDLNQYNKGNNLLMEWSRGCIANCSFCIGKLMLGKYRFKEPNKIIEEIKYYVKEKGIKRFTVVDNLINGDLKKLEETCDLIIENKLEIIWNCEGIGMDMPLQLLEKMKRAGCREFQIGVESGSDVVLKKMRKPYTSKSAEMLVRKAKKTGLKTEIFLMVGFPGETESEFRKTLDFIERNKDYIDLVKSINILHLIAGTDVRDNYKNYGITLPKEEEYYKWYTEESNMEIRNNRVKRVIKLVNRLNIPFLETNIMEGKDKKSDNLKDIDNIITLELAKDVNYNKEKRLNENHELGIKIANDKYKKNRLTNYKNGIILKIRNFFSNNDDTNKIEKIRKKLIPVPKYVTIDLTNSCNLNCIGCWTHSPLLKDKEASEEWKSQMISFEKLKEVINELKELGTERIRLTGGGEPFMHPRIMDVITIIKEKGMACDITTNFTLLNKDKIKELFDLDVDEIVVSLWAGDAETYARMHPNQNEKTFERIRENLEFIAQYKEKLGKGPKVIMANVISNLNYSKIEEIANFATNASLDEIYFTLIDPIMGRTDSLLLNYKERKILIKKLQNIKMMIDLYNKRSKIHKINIDDMGRFIKKIKSEGASKGEYDLSILNKPCYIGYIFARILANGDVVPCCRAVMYPMGNISKESFKDIWFSDEYDEFREKAMNESKLTTYFKKVGCFMTCDNVVHNNEIETIKI